VEAKALDVCSAHSSPPGRVQARSAHRLVPCTAEHETVGPWSGPAGEVRLELRDERVREGDPANAGCGLGWSHNERAVLQLLDLLGDVHGRVQEIEPSASERAELAQPEPSERRGQDQRPVARLDRVGERVDLLNARDRALLRVLDARRL